MGAGWAAAGGGQQRLGHGEQRWLSTEGAGWDPPGCSRVLQHQGSPAEVPLELAARLDPFGQGPSPLQAEVCRSPPFFTYVPTPGGSGGAMRCTGGGILGLARASLGSHERLWELLLRWEVAPGTAPGSFVPKSQLVSFCCGATESLPWMGMCRGLRAQPGTAPEPSPGPCPLCPAMGLSGWPGVAARGMLGDIGTHPAWCPAIPLSVGSRPRSCSQAACESQGR